SRLAWCNSSSRDDQLERTMTETAATVETAARPTYKWFSGGEWHAAPDVFDDYEPYTGDLFAHAPNCGPGEARAAIAAAADAFPAWADTGPQEKARLFFKAAEIVRRRRGETAEIP